VSSESEILPPGTPKNRVDGHGSGSARPDIAMLKKPAKGIVLQVMERSLEMTHQPKIPPLKWANLSNISAATAPSASVGAPISTPAAISLGIALRYLAGDGQAAKTRLRTHAALPPKR